MTHLQPKYDYTFAQLYLQKCREVQLLANRNVTYNETTEPQKQQPPVIVLDDEEDSTQPQNGNIITNPSMVPELNDLQVTGVTLLKEWIDISELQVNPQEINHQPYVARNHKPQKHNHGVVNQKDSELLQLLNQNDKIVQDHIPQKNNQSAGAPNHEPQKDKDQVGLNQALPKNNETQVGIEGQTNDEVDVARKPEVENNVAMNPEPQTTVARSPDTQNNDEIVAAPEIEENEANWADVDVEEAPESPAPTPAPTSKFSCSHCSYQTDWKSNMNKHVVSRHQSQDEIKWYKCPHCPYKGKTSEYLKTHLRQLHEPYVKWHYCTKCPLKFKLKSVFKDHILSVHTPPEDIQWFQCDKCEFKCKFKKQLARHESRIHLKFGEITWFKCEKCDYKTKWKNSLKSHAITRHAGYEDYKWKVCDQCGLLLKAKELENHLISFHCGPKRKKTDEETREWKCDRCGLNTFSRKTFEEHFKTDGRTYFCS
ncbi:transcription factor E4F1 [Tribolium castaneum]|uniref:C2H2-type domain-containing protein n=1 Tax=Tribolium castaneum TaxID=7070 RepID=D6WVP6_TRICA|nr:PREDICTED: transcription factor E4F1 [Tribolium castaneum]XP_015837938.1 PREDICTED: transcription factor E4F1 [Tribolium castaneum]EFA08598.1 hypothetical protein TcasGA2_TC006257 [Tribolium castaneum]|eukprot:XP_008196558.1 PREDICTED: transcription factor E4F1 [Tribolium castaneum]